MSIQPSQPGDRTVSPVPSDEAGRRLDRYLASVLSDMSRTSIQQLIADGAILVNGQASKAGYMLRTGDEIQLVSLAPKAATSKVRPQLLPLDIVYEDEDVLVVNKAAGMVVHPRALRPPHLTVAAVGDRAHAPDTPAPESHWTPCGWGPGVRVGQRLQTRPAQTAIPARLVPQVCTSHHGRKY